MITRRAAIQVSAAGGIAATLAPNAVAAVKDAYSAESLQASLDRYESFGGKASGGDGDRRSGEWLGEELRAAGFKTDADQTFSVPWFEAESSELWLGGNSARVIPQSVVVQTARAGLTAPLRRWRDDADSPAIRGAIAFVDLPSQRRGDIDSVKGLLGRCHAAGAVAVVLVTNGAAQEAQALNAPGDRPHVSVPVVILAPKDASAFREGAKSGVTARLRVVGQQGHREAHNIVGRIDRGAADWLVVTTPRSGWFGCAGERGPGIATWVALARTLPAMLPDQNLMFAALSGHEHHGPGTTLFLNRAPSPTSTALFVHVGGNLATRDFHETPVGLLPLPTPDPQRYIVGAEAFVPKLRTAFAGISGFEAAYPASARAIGDYVEILAKGYNRSFAGFAVSRFHHTEADRLPLMTDGRIVEPVARAFARAITLILR